MYPQLTDGDGQIFDIKTRATHAIRNCFNLLPDVPAHERHLHFLDYKITQQAGLWNSFEREVCLMLRAAFFNVYVCTHTRAHTRTHTICVCVYVYIYIYIYRCTT